MKFKFGMTFIVLATTFNLFASESPVKRKIAQDFTDYKNSPQKAISDALSAPLTFIGYTKLPNRTTTGSCVLSNG